MNYIWQGLTVFLVMAILDFIWAKYTYHTAAKRAFPAAVYAGLIMTCNGVVVTSYVHDIYMIGPAIAGAFVGTYTSIKWFAKESM